MANSRWHHFTLAICNHGTLAPLHHDDTLAPWRPGTMANGTVPQWYYGRGHPRTMANCIAPWLPGTLAPCRLGTIAPWKGTMA